MMAKFGNNIVLSVDATFGTSQSCVSLAKPYYPHVIHCPTKGFHVLQCHLRLDIHYFCTKTLMSYILSLLLWLKETFNYAQLCFDNIHYILLWCSTTEGMECLLHILSFWAHQHANKTSTLPYRRYTTKFELLQRVGTPQQSLLPTRRPRLIL